MSLVVLGVSCLLSWVLVGLIRRAALKLGMMDVPNTRSAHGSPTPRGGGLAIVVATSLAVGINASGEFGSVQIAAGWVVGGGLVALVGLIDDLRGLSPMIRLGVHLSAAGVLLVAMGGPPLVLLPHGPLDLGVFGWLGAAIAIVWSINLFNFMDGIDGLAATQATFVAGAAVVLQTSSGLAASQQFTLLALVGSSAGFLVWNFPTARIFMGDVGSGFIGFALIAAALLTSTHGPTTIWTWVVLNGLFLADATVTLWVRLVRGQRIHEAHSSHIYQQLARRWGSHRNVTILYCAINLLWSLPWAVATVRLPAAGPALAASALVPLFLAAWIGGAGGRGSPSSARSQAGKDAVAVRDIE
jgi:Fuc2NAc and GlcNAc transferase